MLSPKRFAQLGLGSASFVLLTSVAVLMAGSAETPASGSAQPSDREVALADASMSASSMSGSSLASVSAGLTTPTALNKH